MRDCNVVRFMPSLAAAPWAPAITPPDSRTVRKMYSRSASWRVVPDQSRGDEIAIVRDVQNVIPHCVVAFVIQRQMSKPLAHHAAHGGGNLVNNLWT